MYREISIVYFFFFKQKTAYEMRISDWSSDVCSSDLTTVISRKKSSAKRLAGKFKIADYSDSLTSIPADCVVFFLTVPDTELKNLAKEIAKQDRKSVV